MLNHSFTYCFPLASLLVLLWYYRRLHNLGKAVVSLFASLFLSLSIPVPVGTKVERALLPIDGRHSFVIRVGLFCYVIIP
jgi:hypothetical protein